jgi:hypothetical protein
MYINNKLSIVAEPVPLGILSNNLSALRLREIDAFYSAEGSPLTLVDSGELRNLMSLSEIYPQPYTAVVAWASDDLIEANPDLVRKFVTALLEIVSYLKAHPEYATELYVKRTGATKAVADKAVASLNHVLTSEGCGSGHDLVAAVAGNWQFITESGAAPDDISVDIIDVVRNISAPQSSQPLIRVRIQNGMDCACTSAPGTKPTSSDVCSLVAIGGRADIRRTRHFGSDCPQLGSWIPPKIFRSTGPPTSSERRVLATKLSHADIRGRHEAAVGRARSTTMRI